MTAKVKRVEKILASMKGKVEELTNSQVNRHLDQLDEAGSILCNVFIEVGRGHELPSETMRLDDPLAQLYRDVHDNRFVLQNEVSRRYGPSAPRRLPTRR